MIHGVGTDIVRVARLTEALARHGARFAERILDASERAAFAAAPDPARLLAKRFAAKEAFGKALAPASPRRPRYPTRCVGHDALGKPLFEFSPASPSMRERGLHAHLSLSDETDYVVAFAVIEKP